MSVERLWHDAAVLHAQILRLQALVTQLTRMAVPVPGVPLGIVAVLGPGEGDWLVAYS